MLEGIELAGRHGFEGLEIQAEQVLEAGYEQVKGLLDRYRGTLIWIAP